MLKCKGEYIHSRWEPRQMWQSKLMSLTQGAAGQQHGILQLEQVRGGGGALKGGLQKRLEGGGGALPGAVQLQAQREALRPALHPVLHHEEAHQLHPHPTPLLSGCRHLHT